MVGLPAGQPPPAPPLPGCGGPGCLHVLHDRGGVQHHHGQYRAARGEGFGESTARIFHVWIY